MKASTQQAENNLAVISMILGVLSLTMAGPITGIPAIITGIIGLKNPVNKGYSWTGIITGAISTFLTVLVIGIVLLFVLIASSLPQSGSNGSNSDNSQDSGSYFQQRT